MIKCDLLIVKDHDGTNNQLIMLEGSLFVLGIFSCRLVGCQGSMFFSVQRNPSPNETYQPCMTLIR